MTYSWTKNWFRPSATGGVIPGPCPPPNHCLCPPKRELCPPSEDCDKKKLTGSVLLECNSRPETLKILVITPELVSKNCCFVDFAIKTVCFCDFTPKFIKICVYFGIKTFFWGGLYPRFRQISLWTILFVGPLSRIQRNKVFVPPLNLFMPPLSRYHGAGPDLICSIFEFSKICELLFRFYENVGIKQTNPLNCNTLLVCLALYSWF